MWYTAVAHADGGTRATPGPAHCVCVFKAPRTYTPVLGAFVSMSPRSVGRETPVAASCYCLSKYMHANTAPEFSRAHGKLSLVRRGRDARARSEVRAWVRE